MNTAHGRGFGHGLLLFLGSPSREDFRQRKSIIGSSRDSERVWLRIVAQRFLDRVNIVHTPAPGAAANCLQRRP